MINIIRILLCLLNIIFVMKLDSLNFILNIPIVTSSLLIPLYFFIFNLLTEFIDAKVNKRIFVEAYLCLSIFLLYNNIYTIYFLLFMTFITIGCFLINKISIKNFVGTSGIFSFSVKSFFIYNSVICSVASNTFILYNKYKGMLAFSTFIHIAVISSVFALLLSFLYNIIKNYIICFQLNKVIAAPDRVILHELIENYETEKLCSYDGNKINSR